MVAKALRQVFRLDHHIAQTRTRGDDDFRCASGLLVALGQQFFVFGDTGLALRLTGLRAGSNPLLLGGKSALTATLFLLFLSQTLALLFQPRRVVAFEWIAASTLDLENPVGHVVEEVTVMGDDHDGAFVVTQGLFEPCHALGVEMVGRFVEQKQIRLFQQQTAQRDATALTSGELVDGAVSRRAAQRVERDFQLAVEFPTIASIDLLLKIGLLGEERGHLVLVHRLGELGGDLVEAVDRLLQVTKALCGVFTDRQVRVELRLLFEIADLHAFSGPGLATIFLVDPGHDLEQGRFTGAVDTKNTDLGAGHEGQGNALEDFTTARIGLGQVLHHIDILIWRHETKLRDSNGRTGPEMARRANIGRALDPADGDACARPDWHGAMTAVLHAKSLRPAGLEPATKPL